MSSVQSRDYAIVAVLAFDFLVVAPALRYPLWSVHIMFFRAVLDAGCWIGLISAIGLPIWLAVRMVRESAGQTLKIVELVGSLCWLLVFGYLVVSGFTVI